MRTVKTIVEVISEICNFDTVLTIDPGLKDAINIRCTGRLGQIAYTPEELASRESAQILNGESVLSQLDISRKISRKLFHTNGNENPVLYAEQLKYVYGEVSRLKRILRFQADPGEFMVGETAESISEAYLSYNSIESVMSSFREKSTFFNGKSVAVIGFEMFDRLQRLVVPDGCSEICLFKDDVFSRADLGTVYLMGNDRSLAVNAVNLVDERNMYDTAIVIDTKSALYNELVSEMYRHGIPFRNQMLPRDDPDLRNYLSMLQVAFRYTEVKVSEVRHLFAQFGFMIGSRFDDFPLSEYIKRYGQDNGNLRRLGELFSDITSNRFIRSVEVICNNITERKAPLRYFLNKIGMTDSKITEKNFNEIRFMADSVSDLGRISPIPEDERSGLLVVDCNSSAYIDRSNVIYLGMGPEWSADISDVIYITDRKKQDELDRLRFSILIQQGINRVYIAHKIRDGKSSVPCQSFMELFPEDERKSIKLDSFNKICDVSLGEDTALPDPVWKPVDEYVTENFPKKFSKTMYSDFLKCPYIFMFRFLSTSGEYPLVLGNSIHEFCEFYIHHPDYVHEKTFDYYEGQILKTIKSVFGDEISDRRIAEVHNTLLNCVQLIDSEILPYRNECEADVESDAVDFFTDAHLLRRRYSDIRTEVPFESTESPVEGKMDVVVCDNKIWDFKTGRVYDASKYLKQMKDYNDKQPLIYLYLLSESTGDPNCTFNLFFAGSDYLLDGGSDIGQRIVTFKLIDDLGSYLVSDECHIREQFNQEDGEMDDDVWSDFIGGLEEFGFENVSETPYNNNSARLKTIIPVSKLRDRYNRFKKCCSNGLVFDGNVVLVERSWLNDFISQVCLDHDKLTTGLNENSLEFCRDHETCKRCSYYDLCLLSSEEGDVDE